MLQKTVIQFRHEKSQKEEPSSDVVFKCLSLFFRHPTLVDRVAAMLNYVLIHLVGPKRNTLNVKDHRQYEFRPDTLVKRILHIYHNLSDSDTFCLAVTQDGRSYNDELFKQAADIAGM